MKYLKRQSFPKLGKNIFRKRTHKLSLKNIILLVSGIALVIGGVIFVWLATIQIPDFKAFDERRVAKSTTIYDKTGKIALYDIHNDVKRTVIPLADIGDNIKNAVLAIEDNDFYEHSGIRIKSIFRALFKNILSGKLSEGGSTITQQVVKLSLLTNDKTITRKIREVILTLKLDQVMEKDDILAIYLNEVPYGGPVYGIQEGSMMFFGKVPKDVTIAEAAYLAAIPKGPTYYSPYGKNRSALESRKNLVLSRMRDLNYITQEQYDVAKAEEVKFQDEQKTGIKAPHFVFFIKQYLEEKYGAEMVESGGLKVITTLDYELEQRAEEAIANHIESIEKNYNGTNAGLVAIDPKTGQILAMVGSRDYFSKTIDGNFNITTALRQPGSSFKPFVYATAFEKGYTPETFLFDVKTEFNSSCSTSGNDTKSTCYHPDNFDNGFRGPINLRNALAQSINIPAVQLLYMVGVKDALKTSRDMGIKSLDDPDRYGLTLVIGGGEVSLLDMTTAYATFASEGIYHPYQGILKVEDDKGNVLEEYTSVESEALPRNVALTISDVLSDNDARIPTFGANSPLRIPGYDVAAKTGTTNNNKDAWTMGYSPSIAVGVWVGNNDNTAMKKGGVALAGPIWNDFMNKALPKLDNEKFETPAPIETSEKPIFHGIWQGGESYTIDTVSGKLATEYTPKETRKMIAVTNVHSILYWVDRNDPQGVSPMENSKDSLFNHFEDSVRRWWNINGGQYGVVTASQIPTSYDDVHVPQKFPNVDILNLSDGSVINKNSSIVVNFSSSGSYPVTRYDVYVNNQFIGTTNSNSFNFDTSDVDNPGSTNIFKVIAYDSVFNQGEKSITFSVN